MPSYPRILVIDPDAESRAEVQRLLVNSRYVVVGGVGYDEEAPKLASEFKPQVVLIAYQEPVPLALRALQAVKEAAPEAFIIAYSHRGDIQSVRRVILAGAWDYISRPVSLKDLSRSIELALAPASEEREGPEPAVAASHEAPQAPPSLEPAAAPPRIASIIEEPRATAVGSAPLGSPEPVPQSLFRRVFYGSALAKVGAALLPAAGPARPTPPSAGD